MVSQLTKINAGRMTCVLFPISAKRFAFECIWSYVEVGEIIWTNWLSVLKETFASTHVFFDFPVVDVDTNVLVNATHRGSEFKQIISVSFQNKKVQL